MSECEECGTTRGLIHHHISYEPEVTQILCRLCHSFVHTSVDVPKRPKNYQPNYSALTKLTQQEREMPNTSIEILRVIEMNPRISPKLIQEYIEHAPSIPLLQVMLKPLRDLSLVESPQQGMYLITAKGREALQTSEKTQKAER